MFFIRHCYVAKIGHTKLVVIGMQLVFNHSLIKMYSPNLGSHIFLKAGLLRAFFPVLERGFIVFLMKKFGEM